MVRNGIVTLQRSLPAVVVTSTGVSRAPARPIHTPSTDKAHGSTDQVGYVAPSRDFAAHETRALVGCDRLIRRARTGDRGGKVA
jgi:hypothetical protein